MVDYIQALRDPSLPKDNATIHTIINAIFQLAEGGTGGTGGVTQQYVDDADTALQTSIDTEVTDRANADATLTNNVALCATKLGKRYFCFKQYSMASGIW